MNVETRQKIERGVAKRVIASTLARGYTVSVYDGEETVLRCSVDSSAILKAMFSTDEDRLFIHHAGEKRAFGWVYFIYGENGWDVINDYTMNLEEVLQDADAYADKMEERYG